MQYQQYDQQIEELTREQEERVEELTNMYEMKMAQIKENCEQMYTTYIPRKSDMVDQALAKVINEYPEKERMKILFLRESEGVYYFGQKRIHVRVEKGNQVLVRVGGGFMTVSEFIETYTPLEVNKIERRDVTRRFTHKL